MSSGLSMTQGLWDDGAGPEPAYANWLAPGAFGSGVCRWAQGKTQVPPLEGGPGLTYPSRCSRGLEASFPDVFTRSALGLGL